MVKRVRRVVKMSRSTFPCRKFQFVRVLKMLSHSSCVCVAADSENLRQCPANSGNGFRHQRLDGVPPFASGAHTRAAASQFYLRVVNSVKMQGNFRESDPGSGSMCRKSPHNSRPKIASSLQHAERSAGCLMDGFPCFMSCDYCVTRPHASGPPYVPHLYHAEYFKFTTRKC